MLRLRWLQVLRSLGLEFWLVLPLLGLVLWVSSGFLTDRLLNRFYNATDHLELDKRRERQAAKTVLAIEVATNQLTGVSNVIVQLDNSSLKELRFQFSTINADQIELAISQELALPRDQVRELMRFQVEPQ